MFIVLYFLFSTAKVSLFYETAKHFDRKNAFCLTFFHFPLYKASNLLVHTPLPTHFS